jgi:hypothetical protein
MSLSCLGIPAASGLYDDTQDNLLRETRPWPTHLEHLVGDVVYRIVSHLQNLGRCMKRLDKTYMGRLENTYISDPASVVVFKYTDYSQTRVGECRGRVNMFIDTLQTPPTDTLICEMYTGYCMSSK